jgi:hypothetical protein
MKEGPSSHKRDPDNQIVHDYLDVGDVVSIRYAEASGAKRATEIRVQKAAEMSVGHSACREETCSKADCKGKCGEKPCACGKSNK